MAITIMTSKFSIEKEYKGIKTIYAENRAAWRRWLQKNHAKEKAVWLIMYKMKCGTPSVYYKEAVEEALCFGWIDAVRKRIDDESYQIRFTRRKPTSIWSAVNIAKFQALEAEGRMTDAGRAAYAHRSDKKSAIYSYEKAGMPELTSEEVALFKRNRPAWKFFESTPPSYRKKVIARVLNAKRAETRAARLQKLIEASAEGVRLE